jgi:S-disulfanyl-L-cysteine oxidoreductase SoxD
MGRTRGLMTCVVLSTVIAASVMSEAHAQTLATATYTASQAEQGKGVFMAQCSSCHGDNLDNGDFGPPLAGPPFRAHWGGQSLDKPYSFMVTQMPPDNPGGLDPVTYSELMAFILSKNGIPPSNTELPSDVQKLKSISVPK